MAALTLFSTVLAAALWPLDAAAQQGARAVERYNRVARGANIDEWHKRLFDPDPATRLEAVDSLGKDGTEESVKPLLDATTDSDPRVRAMAIDYLGLIGSPRATQVLTQYLFLSDVDRPSKQRVLVALGRIRDPGTVKSLESFVKNTQDEDLRCGAIHALGEIGGSDALEVIKPYADTLDNAHIKRVANDAITKINRQLANAPKNQQPSIVELERAFAPPPRQGR